MRPQLGKPFLNLFKREKSFSQEMSQKVQIHIEVSGHNADFNSMKIIYPSGRLGLNSYSLLKILKYDQK
jgi:hypothetical protein